MLFNIHTHSKNAVHFSWTENGQTLIGLFNWVVVVNVNFQHILGSF